MSTLGLIPARGGSKGIPRKNVRVIGGKPLIVWTIDAARQATRLDRVVVTTDDVEIAAVAAEHGAEVPFLRPAALARDETPGIAPVLHAIDALPGYDTVVLLQPTSPLRDASDIDNAIALAAVDTPVVSVTAAPHAGWTFAMRSDGILDIGDAPVAARRQDQAPFYALNGAIYVANTAMLRVQRTFLTAQTRGYVMPAKRSVDIDDDLDWRLADLLLAERGR